MENSIVVPFDLNTARKIKSGEIEGSVLIDNIEIEFVYESKDCAGPYNLLFVRKDEHGISAIYANTEGCALGDTTLELRVEAGAYFSVWHDAREKPDKGKLLIVEDIDGAYDLVYLTKSKPWEELSEKDHYMRWAYIEDLLPCEEERG